MTNVLFVTYDFPYPPTSGGKSRAFNLMKYSKEGVNLNLLSFVRDDYEKSWNKYIEEIGVKTIHTFKRKKLKSALTLSKNFVSKNSIFKTLYFDKGFERLLSKIVSEEKIDVVHFESTYTGYFIGEKLKEIGVKQILGTENIEYMLYEDFLKNSSSIIKKQLLSYQVQRLKREEENMMKLADISLAVTEEEAAHIRKISGKRCEVIENAISVEKLKFGFSKKTNNNLLFVGNFTYMPNIRAAQFFLKEIFPKFDPEVKVTIIGKKAKDYFKSSERIILKEFVEDLVYEYKNSDCLVFPIKIGGGTNFKILEAMALGTPVLGFPDKIENTGARDGKEFYKATSAEEFLVQYQRIKENREEASKIAFNARKLIEEKYSWIKVGEKLNKIWKEKNE